MTSNVSSINTIEVNLDWLETQKKSIAAFAEEVNNPDTLKLLSKRLKHLSNTHITKPHTFADNQSIDNFVGSKRWTFPFDDTVTCPDLEEFFYNASNLPEHILAQSPLTTTFENFWKMIIHNETNTIIALNMPEEDMDEPDPKPVEYWKHPSQQSFTSFDNCCNLDSSYLGQTVVSFDKWSIQLVSQEVVASQEQDLTKDAVTIIKRQLVAKNSETSQERYINHFHFQNWPDFESTPSEKLVIELLKQANQANEPKKARMVVHCAAGMGRAPAVVACDILIKEISSQLQQGIEIDEVQINPAKLIHEMRTYRKDIAGKSSIVCIARVLAYFQAHYAKRT